MRSLWVLGCYTCAIVWIMDALNLGDSHGGEGPAVEQEEIDNKTHASVTYREKWGVASGEDG